MNERTRQILKGRITSILFKAGDEQANLTSRGACEKIADDILEAVAEEDGTYMVNLDRATGSFA